MTDTIADYLTRVRNAIKAKHRVVEIPANNMKKAMTEILYKQGYILNYKFEASESKQDIIKIALKYDISSGVSAIRTLQRASKPGLRKYAHAEDLPRVINGLGVAIISTSKGLMTEKEARKQHIGGEVICFIS